MKKKLLRILLIVIALLLISLGLFLNDYKIVEILVETICKSCIGLGD